MFTGTVTTTTMIVVALATARVTRLITTDDLTDPVRLWLAVTFESDFVDKLFSCNWCIGFWASAFSVALHLNYPDSPVLEVIFLSFAVSEVVGLTSTLQSYLADRLEGPTIEVVVEPVDGTDPRSVTVEDQNG